MALIAKSDLEARVGAAEVARYSRNSDAKVTADIAKAESRMRSEAIKWCKAASWDAMTSATVPQVAVIYLVSDAIDLLSSGSNRPESIEAKAEEARYFRIRLAKNEERCFDAVLVAAGGSGADVVRVKGPDESRFDFDDTSSSAYSRDLPI